MYFYKGEYGIIRMMLIATADNYPERLLHLSLMRLLRLTGSGGKPR
jgi:hypothetical protein